MSWQARLLNAYLRRTEKPHMRRVKDPVAMRRSFERKARLFFHPPRDVAQCEVSLCATAALELGAGDVTVFYIHGGAFVFGSPRCYRAMGAHLARRTGARVILPAYPLAPEHPFPAALDHLEQAYHSCRADTPGARLVLGGDSAGGALALALLARLIRRGGVLPDAVFALSPVTDLTHSGRSFTENAQAEAVLAPERAADLAQMYLAGTSPRHPEASPLFAEFSGAPPVWITAGDTEILRDDSRRMVDRLRDHGVCVTYREEPDLPHVWSIFHTILPEARATLDALARWIRDQTGANTATR